MSCVRRKGRAAHLICGNLTRGKNDLNICAHLCGSKRRKQNEKWENILDYSIEE